MEQATSELVIYQEAGQPVQVRLDKGRDTVWLTQRQMSAVFDITPENVLMHLKNVFQDGELAEEATTKEFLVVQAEGTRNVQRSDIGLAALTLLVAESDPAQKDVMIRLVMNMLAPETARVGLSH